MDTIGNKYYYLVISNTGNEMTSETRISRGRIHRIMEWPTGEFFVYSQAINPRTGKGWLFKRAPRVYPPEKREEAYRDWASR